MAARAEEEFAKIAAAIFVANSEVTMNNPCILQVEDDSNEVLVLHLAFVETGITDRVWIVNDGQQAIDYLAGQGQFEDRRRYPIPDIILLDLNIPYLCGFDVLQWIREQRPFSTSPSVIVFTSSENPADVERAYQLGATSFIVKPHNLQDLLEFSKLLKGWWLTFNKFPDIRRANIGVARNLAVSQA